MGNKHGAVTPSGPRCGHAASHLTTGLGCLHRTCAGGLADERQAGHLARRVRAAVQRPVREARVLQRQRVLQAATKGLFGNCRHFTRVHLARVLQTRGAEQESWLRRLKGAPETAARPP